MTEIEVLNERPKKVKQSGWDAYKSTYSRVYQRETGHLMVEFLDIITIESFGLKWPLKMAGYCVI